MAKEAMVGLFGAYINGGETVKSIEGSCILSEIEDCLNLKSPSRMSIFQIFL